MNNFEFEIIQGNTNSIAGKRGAYFLIKRGNFHNKNFRKDKNKCSIGFGIFLNFYNFKCLFSKL